jgi:hypothetical protein
VVRVSQRQRLEIAASPDAKWPLPESYPNIISFDDILAPTSRDTEREARAESASSPEPDPESSTR